MATFMRQVRRIGLLRRPRLPYWSLGCRTVMNEEAAGENVPDELRTTVTMLNIEDKDSMFINSYSPFGFRLSNGIQVVGPCVFFPKSLLQWNIRSGRHITPESLTLFPLLEPRLDLLIIGVGEKENLQFFTSETMRFLRTRRLNIEVLPTDQALSTYNFLNSEKRYIAAALVPPTYVSDITNEESYDAAFPDPKTGIGKATLDWSEDKNFLYGNPKEEGDLPPTDNPAKMMQNYISKKILQTDQRQKDARQGKFTSEDEMAQKDAESRTYDEKK